MFDRWDEAARLSVVIGQQIAMDSGAESVGTDHLLLGLRVLGDDVTTKALDEAGMPAAGRPPGFRVSTFQIPINPATKAALERSSRDGPFGDHDDVRPGHVLLALLPTPAVLAELGKYDVDVARLRERVIELLDT